MRVGWMGVIAAASLVALAAGEATARDWVTSQADYEACLAGGGKVVSDAARGQSAQLYCVSGQTDAARDADCRAAIGPDAFWDAAKGRCGTKREAEAGR